MASNNYNGYSGKIDIHRMGDKVRNGIKKIEADNSLSERNRKFILSFLRDAELGKTIKNGQKKKIGPARLWKYITVLKIFALWLGKDFDKATQEDMERVILALEKDEYKTKIGNSYSEETKVDFKKMAKKFYKWLLGNNDHYPDLVAWFDTSLKEKEIPALTKQEVEKLVENSPNLLQKATIMLLFDSGARAEEFLNIRLKHLTRKDDYYMVRIEYSKTKPRTISVSLCTKLLDELLKEQNINDPETPLFRFSYTSLRLMLYRLGPKVLKKPVYPHLLRHSSATYYANIERNYFRFCKRYGWSFGSRMAQRYIDRAGIDEEETANAVKIDEISKIKNENQKLQGVLNNLKVKYDELIDWKEDMSRKAEIINRKKTSLLQANAKALGEQGLAEDYVNS